MSPEKDGFWLQNPVELPFHINSRFNDPREYKNNPTKRQAHEGIDLHAVNTAGKPVAVLAAQRGVVDKVGNYPPGYGNYIRIRHDWPNGQTYVTWYGHLSKIEIKQGEFVQAGERIGVAGDTGFAFGIHLHLTLQHIGHGLSNYVVDDVVDPEPYFHNAGPAEIDECGFLADLTIPDGTTILPGQMFPKTWRVRNNGTRAWGQGFELAYFDGDRLGESISVALPKLAPGKEGDVTVKLAAPSLAGRYRSIWKARDPNGGFFPFEMFAEIVVASARQVGAEFVEDLTIPDGTPVGPKEIFLKKWRVRNSGTTSWGKGYTLGFFSDRQMGAPGSLVLPVIKAGEVAEISISLRAPEEAGTYQSTWRLRTPDGAFFGDALFAIVNVVKEIPAGQLVDQMSYVDDVTFTDGTQVGAGQSFEKIWRVRNSGTSAWKTGYTLGFFGGDRMGGPDPVPLPEAEPGQTVDIHLPLVAPADPGLYRSTWKPHRLDGSEFDYEVFAEIEVVRGVEPGDQVDDARFVRDVTTQPGSVKRSGESFLKIWRVRNTGTSAWGGGYQLVYNAGEGMGGDATPLPPAAPGDEVNVSTRLTAPLNPGRYEAIWRLRAPGDELFGQELPLDILVPSPLPPTNQRNGESLVGYDSFMPGAKVKPGQEIQFIWRVRNTGNTTWGSGYSLVFTEGERFEGPESQPLPVCPPAKTDRLVILLKMPQTEGDFQGVWRLRSPAGKLFGARLTVELSVRSGP